MNVFHNIIIFVRVDVEGRRGLPPVPAIRLFLFVSELEGDLVHIRAYPRVDRDDAFAFVTFFDDRSHVHLFSPPSAAARSAGVLLQKVSHGVRLLHVHSLELDLQRSISHRPRDLVHHGLHIKILRSFGHSN